MRLQALVLLTAFAILTGLLHASLFITPPGYYTLVSNSPNPCTPVITTGGSIPSTEGGGAILTSLPTNSYVIGFVMLALVLSIMVVAIIYMVGKLFPSTGLLGWVNQEYWEIAKSGIIVVMIFSLLLFISNIGVALTNTPVTAYSATDTYLNNMNGLVYSSETYLLTADSYVAAGWCTLGSVNFGVALLNSLKIEYYVPIPIPIILTGLKFGTKFSILSTPTLLAGNDNTVGQLQSIMTDLIIGLYYPVSMIILVLIEALPIIVWVGIGFLIPIGLVFRALPILRGIGGTLIATGIAMAVLLPMMLVVFNYPVTQVFQSVLPIQTITPSSTCNFGSTVISYACKAFIFVINGENAYIGNGVRVIYSLGWGFSAFNGLYTILNVLTPYSVFMMIQLILFILDAIIINAIADNIAKALGGGIKLSLGGKLKLI